METITPQKAYELLAEKLRTAGREAQQNVVSRLRAATGKFTPLPVYHCDKSIDDKDKLAFYASCIRAIDTGDWTDAKVQEKPAPEPDKPQECEEDKPASAPAQPEPERNILITRIQPPATGQPMSPVARAIFDEIAPHLKMAADDGAMACIAERVFTHQINNGGLPVDRINAMIDARLAKVLQRIAESLSKEVI